MEVAAAVAAEQQQQWQKEVEKREEEELEVALQLRRQRASVADVDVSDASNGGVMLPYSEPADEIHQEELQNAAPESNGVPSNTEQESDEDEGTISKYGFSMPENDRVQVSACEINLGDNGLIGTEKELKSQNLRDNSFSGLKLLPSTIEEKKVNGSYSVITAETVNTEVIKESDPELTELDVERVLKEQNTHDLYCPNCHSCITRRVILRKRKRRNRIPDEEAKHNKSETEIASHLEAISEHTTNDQNAVDTNPDGSQTPAIYEDSRDSQPEIFRCLSCLSFFIPTGDGFKLFKAFGDKREKDNLQNRHQTSSVKKNWFSSLFASHKEETLVDLGVGREVGVEANIVGASQEEIESPPQPLDSQGPVKSSTGELLEGQNDIVHSSIEGPEVPGKVVANRGEKSDEVKKEVTETVGPHHPVLNTVTLSSSSDFSNEMLMRPGTDHPATELPGKSPLHTEESVKNATSRPQQEGLKILVQTSTESSTAEKSLPDQKLNIAIEKKSTDDEDWLFPKTLPVYEELDIKEKVNPVVYLPSQNGKNIGIKLPNQSIVEGKNVEIKLSDASYPYGIPHSTVGTKVDIHIEKASRADGDAFSPSLTTSLLLPDRHVNIRKDLKDVPDKTDTGSDTIVIVTEKAHESATSQQAQDMIASAGTGHIALSQSAEEGRESQGVDVIKSIIYGGLVESITSLSVVSSAAGSDTSTINIVALGLANLIGGLFIIGHNLWELKNDEYGISSDQVTEDTSNQRIQRLDKYQDLLGRRENFLLHATVAVLSYLIFGLLPPVIYGFSFRVSNNRDFKLLAVAVASLFCIIVLSTGKAYVQRSPKAYIRTIFYYVILGFMASGVSYAAGDLIKKLMENLGWLTSGFALSVPIIEESSMQPGWSSY